MRRRIILWGVVCCGLVGALLAAGAAMASNTGGLPQCQTNLNVCTTTLNTCTTDKTTLQGQLNTCNTSLGTCETDLAVCLAEPHAGLPATGQIGCWDSSGTLITCAGTGQDGDIQAGAALSYTDNGDGTITDNATGRMWEKQSRDGTIHDESHLYTWDNAFLVHIAGLNAGAGFAGHKDWRLPNINELQSIVNYENTSPPVSPAFNNGCVLTCTVLTCSCTAATTSVTYWTSTTYRNAMSSAWVVQFSVGGVEPAAKTTPFKVRAVRGGQ